jgi:hypothetical protein
LCTALNIASWLVMADGPDRVSVVADCAGEEWGTGRQLFELREGRYRVTVRAMTERGITMASREERVDLPDDGRIHSVALQFKRASFRTPPRPQQRGTVTSDR